ncbi:protein FAM72A-like [Halichondria panicea]|uniref:protein FAM72A-like n=1 Tax=Halichondria panicea TaxID=6063 RepID=UPI00312B9EC0
MSQSNCFLHPSFQSKPVYELHCMHCENTVCLRGMKAILLADRSVELFSTDHPPLNSLKSVGKEYQTTKCLCWISDVACSICGQAAGYHVRVPCQSCLSSCNNGHFWMYHSDSVRSEERLDASGEHILVWAEIPPLSEDTVTHDNKLSYIECSR